jgi:MFS family permease
VVHPGTENEGSEACRRYSPGDVEAAGPGVVSRATRDERSGGGSETAADEPKFDASIIALLTSVLCSSTASIAGVTALGKQVYDITGSELALGLIGLAEFAPAFFLMLVTGAVADRFDRRRVARTAGCLAAVFALGLAWYASTDPSQAGPIFLLVIGFGVARAFINPAARALPADVVAPSRYPWLVARASIASQSAFILGPLLGGFLYAVHPMAPYIAMAVLLLLSAVAISFVRLHESSARRERRTERTSGRQTLSEAMQGLRFIRTQPVLLGAISLDLFAVLFGGAVALLPAIAEDELGVGSIGYGFLRAAVGIGAGAVTLFIVKRPVTRRVGRTLLVAVAIFGAFTVVLGLTRSYVVAFVAVAALSGADAVSVFIRSTLLPLVTPTEVRGRVMAVEMVFIGASNELGAFESGVAGELLGAPGAVVLGGIATMLIAVIWWRLFPALRDIDRFPSVTV